MIVAAAHPAVVCHTPRRGERERLALVAMRTTVDVPEARPSDFEPLGIPIGRGEAGSGLHACAGGGLWRPLTWHPEAGVARDVSADELAAWLESSPDRIKALDHTFRGSPLGTWGRGGWNDVTNVLSPAPRGSRVDVDRSFAIRRDSRGAAPAAAARFVADRLRVVSGQAWIRVTPALALSGWLCDPRGVASFGECDTRTWHNHDVWASPLSAGAACAHRRFTCLEDPRLVAILEAWEGLGTAAATEERCLLAVLESAIKTARQELDCTIDGQRPDAPWLPGMRARRAEIRELELDALTGLSDIQAAPRHMETVLAGLDAAAGPRRSPTRFGSDTKTLIYDLRGHYLPAARRAAELAGALPEEDMAGLAQAAGIAP